MAGLGGTQSPPEMDVEPEGQRRPGSSISALGRGSAWFRLISKGAPGQRVLGMKEFHSHSGKAHRGGVQTLSRSPQLSWYMLRWGPQDMRSPPRPHPQPWQVGDGRGGRGKTRMCRAAGTRAGTVGAQPGHPAGDGQGLRQITEEEIPD